MTMLVGALVLVWARLCWAAISANEGWTVEQLLESKQWRNIETQLILTEPGEIPAALFMHTLAQLFCYLHIQEVPFLRVF